MPQELLCLFCVLYFAVPDLDYNFAKIRVYWARAIAESRLGKVDEAR
jgi:hypothetical protein